MKPVLLFFLFFFINACSGSFVGPITKTQYKVEVGCTTDMEHYKEEREQVLKDKDADHRDIDCPVEDNTGHPY